MEIWDEAFEAREAERAAEVQGAEGLSGVRA